MKVTVQRKILSVCSQAGLGRRLGRRAQTVNGWFKNKVPGEYGHQRVDSQQA